MSHNKGANLESTFSNPWGSGSSKSDAAGANTKGNSTPEFSKPHDKGPATIPVVFDEDLAGKDYRGSVDKKAADILAGPMGGH